MDLSFQQQKLRGCLTADSLLDYGLPLAREESGGTEEARGPRKACLF